MSLKALILSNLLHYANRDIPFFAKEEFYAVKKKLLEKYAIHVDEEYQHIKKECYTCGATGKFNHYYRGIEMCFKCYGTGIYEEFITILSLYEFGRYYFHIPKSKQYIHLHMGGKLPNVKFIEGYINHTTPKYNIGLECALWLLLWYDFETFRKTMKMSKRCRPRTPLVFVQSAIWFFRRKEYKIWFEKKPEILVYQDNSNYEDLPF